MLLLRLAFFLLLTNQQACQQENDKPLLLINPIVHTGDGRIIENAALGIEGETISLLADARLIRLDMSAYEVIEAYGLHLYPAALLSELPDTPADSVFFAALEGEDSYVISSAQPSALIQPLQEGARADLLLTEQPLKPGVKIQYLMIGGRLKQESSLALQLLTESEK